MRRPVHEGVYFVIGAVYGVYQSGPGDQGHLFVGADLPLDERTDRYRENRDSIGSWPKIMSQSIGTGQVSFPVAIGTSS